MSLEHQKAVLPAERHLFAAHQHTLNDCGFRDSSKEAILGGLFEPMFQPKRVGKETDFPPALGHPAACVRKRDGFRERLPFQVGTQFGQTSGKFFRSSRSIPEEFMMLNEDGWLAKKKRHREDPHSVPIMSFENREPKKRILGGKKQVCTTDFG